jgi:hypothetical protein
LAQQKTIEAPQAILTLGKHGWRTAEMFCASQLKRIAGKGPDKKAKTAHRYRTNPFVWEKNCE